MIDNPLGINAKRLLARFGATSAAHLG